jgi:hypothetical protein
MRIFTDSLTFVNKQSVIAHNFPEKLVRLQKSPYLCSVKTKQELPESGQAAQAKELRNRITLLK